jgi:hypothetical protein
MSNFEPLRVAVLIRRNSHFVLHKPLYFIQHIEACPSQRLVDEQQATGNEFFDSFK